MRELKIVLHKFEELSDKSKRRVLAIMQEINLHGDWWRQTKDEAEAIGLQIIGFDVRQKQYVDGEFMKVPAEVAKLIIKEHAEGLKTYESATKYMEAKKELLDRVSNKDGSIPAKKAPEYEEADVLLKGMFLKRLCDDYLAVIKEEYDFRVSNGAISEALEGFEFTGDGELFLGLNK